jgi:hypothetical protein
VRGAAEDLRENEMLITWVRMRRPKIDGMF